MQSKSIDDTEISSTIDSSVTQLDNSRLSGLNTLKQFQQTKQGILKQEKDRLAQKNSNDPRIQKITDRLSYNEQMFSGLNTVMARAETKPAPLPLNAWRMQGYVYNPDNTPASGATVFFSHHDKNWVKGLGSVCTDQTGYYSLTITEHHFVNPNTEQPIYLSAYDKKEQLSYMDTKASVPAKGQIDNKDINLGTEPCTPPAPPAREDSYSSQKDNYRAKMEAYLSKMDHFFKKFGR